MWIAKATREREVMLFIFLIVLAATIIINEYLFVIHQSGTSRPPLQPYVMTQSPAVEPVEHDTVQNSGIRGISYDQIRRSGIRFDQAGRDVLVFLHVQKTGGSQLEKQLTLHLDGKRSCNCGRDYGCRCYRPNSSLQRWLFSMQTSLYSCGVHPAWTWLTQCIGAALRRLEQQHYSRRYFYMTMLREPVSRYISEWRHQQDHGGWGVINWCTGDEATQDEIAPCSFAKKTRSTVTLDDFLQCDSNMANNRETWMLADLRLVQCYNNTSNMSTSQRQRRDQMLLQNAKDNLQQMSFFGLTERQRENQGMFEQTFSMRFLEPLEQFNITRAGQQLKEITQAQMQMIRRRNQLDIQLYRYAEQLFNERFDKLKTYQPRSTRSAE